VAVTFFVLAICVAVEGARDLAVGNGGFVIAAFAVREGQEAWEGELV
jgi:hypothetical protein